MPLANTMIPRQTTVRAPNEKSKKSLRAKSMPSSGRRAALELAAAEEGEREPEALRHVHVDADPVAGLAAADVVREEVDGAVGVRLQARPQHGGDEERGRGLEAADALEVLL